MKLKIKELFPDLSLVREKIFPYAKVAKEFFVLRGNLEVMEAIANHTKHKNKVYLIVFDYAPGETPFVSEIDSAISLFEELAFAGMNPARFPYLAVVVKTKLGRTVVYLVGLTTDTRTGKYYNPVPPNWKPYYRLLEEYLNYRFGYQTREKLVVFDGEVVPFPRRPNLEKAERTLDELKEVIKRHAVYNQEKYSARPIVPSVRYVTRTKIEDEYLPLERFEIKGLRLDENAQNQSEAKIRATKEV